MAGLDDNGAKFGILLLASFSRIWTGHFEKSAGSKKNILESFPLPKTAWRRYWTWLIVGKHGRAKARTSDALGQLAAKRPRAAMRERTGAVVDGV
jgi:hypothetical protein